MGQWVQWCLNDLFNGLVLLIILGVMIAVAAVVRFLGWLMDRF